MNNCRRKNRFYSRYILWITLQSVIGISPVGGQNPTGDVIEQLAEKISETGVGVIDIADQTDDLEQLRSHPVNLNGTTLEELRELPFLSEMQVCNLYLYIQAYGQVYSPYELLTIEGFDSLTVTRLLPCVSIGRMPEKHRLNFRDIFRFGKNELIFRYGQVMQKQKGYLKEDQAASQTMNNGYLGNPHHYLFRYKFSYADKVSFGFTGEKDPGEQFFRGEQSYGMDFYSGYFSLRNIGFLKSLTVGTFRAGFGQGLVLGTGLSFSSIPGGSNLHRNVGSVRPSLSSTENGYLKGIAATFRIKNIEISGFYSGHKTDANPVLYDTVSGEVDQVSSMNGTGYHRTPGEISDKNVVRERIIGGNINFRNNYFSAGVTGFQSHWSASLLPRSYPYNKFSFTGKENLNLGVDFQAAFKNIYIFGEAGISRNGGTAWLAGAEFTPHQRLSFTLLFRNYQRNYQNMLSNALGQNSSNSNERGITLTFAITPFSKLSVSGFADIFEFPWLKYQVDFPSRGVEFQLRGDYSVAPDVKMYLRIRLKTKEENQKSGQEPLSRRAESNMISLRYQADWSINPEIVLKSRFECIKNQSSGQEGHYGYLISQGLSAKQVIKSISLSAHYVLFDTETYYERIYSHESDVLYGFSVQGFYGKGIRFAILAEWTPARWLTFWVKFGNTWYSDRDVIGSGLEEIEGNNRSELTCQVRVRF